jgi:hypothetical protein
MHRQVREHLEEVLTEPGVGVNVRMRGAPSGVSSPQAGSEATMAKHLAECHECGEEVRAMREQAALLRQLRPSTRDGEELSPRPGFYARVMERIEAEGAGSIWSLFFESVFGRRLAAAALALAVLLGVCLVSAERFSGVDPQVAEQPGQVMPALRGQVVFGEDQPGAVLTGSPDQDSVLVNLVTYREQ